MQNKLFKKGLVVGIIVLFISIVFSQSIIAVDLSKQDSVDLNNNTSSVSETFNRGYDIAVVDIVPYTLYPYPETGFLYFAPVLKNVGNTTYNGKYYYSAVAINLWNNEEEDSFWCGGPGDLQPGEEWLQKFGHGLEFSNGPYPPTPFSLQFTATPSDSNPKNNYAEAIYLIWGGWLMNPPSYIKIKDITHNIKPRTIDYQFIENFPLLHRLLDNWRWNPV